MELALLVFFDGAAVLNVQLSLLHVHQVEFGFEFETQLDFLFVILHVLMELFLETEAEILLVGALLLKLFIKLLQLLDVGLEQFLVLKELVLLLFELALEFVHLLLVVRVDLSNHHLVVGRAAVLQQDRERFPEARDQRMSLS